MPKKTAIIIDDESLARAIIKRYLESFDQIEIVGEATDGFQGLKLINELKPDIIFLDIQMPKLSGFELIEILDQPPFVIFTTAYDEFAIKAFEVNAIDYLLKPFSLERFSSAIQKITDAEQPLSFQSQFNSLLKTRKETEYLIRVVTKDGSKINIIPTEKIRYIESQDDYVMIHSSEGKFIKKETTTFFEQNLNPSDFVRVHRSYVVALKCVKQIEIYEKESYRIILDNKEILPVSKAGYKKLKEIFQ